MDEKRLIQLFLALRNEIGSDIKLNCKEGIYYLEVGRVIWSKEALKIIKDNHIRVI